MIGRNSGMRSIGEITQIPANAIASFARRGTRGSLRKVLIVVTQAGRNPARSLRMPGGRRAASPIMSTHDAVRHPSAISRTQITAMRVPRRRSVQ